MIKAKYKRDDLLVAGLRYFDKEHNGIELGDNLSYVIIAKNNKDDNPIYYNVFDISESYPVFSRSLYTNYTKEGEAYGTKMISHGGWLETGPCWVIEEELSPAVFNEEVSLNDLEKAILASDKYFKDRKEIAKRNLKSHPIKLLQILSKDSKSEDYMNYYFDEREIQKTKRK